MNGRDLERGTVENRIVERAIVRRLNQHLDKDFTDSSYGFRPRRSPERALVDARRAIRGGSYWALKTDIKGFFDHIVREILEAKIRAVIADELLYETILSAVSPVRLVGNLSCERCNGLPQGNGIAPFFSNLYLTEFDERCADLQYFRYADDILVLGSNKQEVKQAKARVLGLVKPLGLRLNPQKTFVRDLRRCPLTFLGYELRGGNIYPPRRAIRKFEKNLKKFWGQKEQGLALMKNFVRRFQIGPVRKALRRLDHKLLHLLPPGPSLVDMFDALHEVTRAKEGQNLAAIDRRQWRRSRRQGCRYATEKAARQAPTAVATGGGDPHRTATPAQRENNTIREVKFMTKSMRDPEYLNFIRPRPCSFCGRPTSDPHHSIKRLRGLSEAGMGQKGPDYLAIPMCRKCHRKLHDGELIISREELLEICAINLICYIRQLKNPSLVQKINAARQEDQKTKEEKDRNEV